MECMPCTCIMICGMLGDCLLIVHCMLLECCVPPQPNTRIPSMSSQRSGANVSSFDQKQGNAADCVEVHRLSKFIVPAKWDHVGDVNRAFPP